MNNENNKQIRDEKEQIFYFDFDFIVELGFFFFL